jgi:hypothetical protein
VFDFALLDEAPAAAGVVEVAVLVAFAYERTGSCAGTAPDCGVVVPLLAGAGEAEDWAAGGFCAAGEATLVICGSASGNAACDAVVCSDGAGHVYEARRMCWRRPVMYN